MQTRQLIRHCIETEDKKNPYTDEKIAEILDLSREIVTNIRKELKIPDSRERRKSELHKAILQIIKAQPQISDRQLTKKLNDQYFVIGKYAVSKIRQELTLNKTQNTTSTPIFSHIIGYDGSLKNIINRALAALIYPPFGMHCLYVGQVGTGKSTLIKEVLNYAQTLERYQQHFYCHEINCQDYKHNEKQLLVELFGYQQQAGLLETMNQGIICLNQIDSFPIQGKEMLLKYLNTGQFQRLDNPEIFMSSTMIIATLNTAIEDYQRNFSMVIQLPSFEQRPMKEKLAYIQKCFQNESQCLNDDITVKKEALYTLLSYPFPDNFQQVQNEIKVSCAKALLDKKISDENSMIVAFDNLSDTLKSTYYAHNRETRMLIRGDMIFASSGHSVLTRSDITDSWDIYELLDEKFDELKAQGLSNQEAGNVLVEEMEMSLSKQIHNVEKSKMSKDEISAIVGKTILELSSYIYDKAKKELPYLSDSMIFPLAIHLKMMNERQVHQKARFVREINKIKQNNPKEYLIAKNMIQNIQKKILVQHPEEETCFLAIYFQKFQSRYYDNQKKIAVLVVSHGHVASAMAQTANMIMGEYHAVGLDLEFSDSPKIMADKVIAKVHEIDQGKGCIILADMGSLLQVGERVEKEIGVAVGVLGRCDTLMVIECLRKTLWTNETIDEIVESLDIKETRHIYQNQNRIHERAKAILTCCVTGEGAAIQLENYLKVRFESVFKDVKWLHLGYVDETSLMERIEDLNQKYEIMAIVGTLDPHISDIPFYTSQQVYQKEGFESLKTYCYKYLGIYNPLIEVLDQQCISILSGNYTKEEVIDNAVAMMVEANCVDENYLLSVYKREAWLPTYLQGGIGIPHGESQYVTKPVIHITKLDKPVCWDGENFVDFVFTLALKEDQTEAFEELYKQMREPSFMQILKLCTSQEDILEKFMLIQY